VRKKLNAAAGLVTIAAAGALIASTPAFAEEDISSVTGASAAVAVPASATIGHQLSLFAGAKTVARSEGRRHRRHRRHFRHHRHHRHHHRYHRYHRGYY
jgi:hypothetical protein